MKTFLALALVLSACSHHSDPKTPASDDMASADNSVDPTLPSWAPRSCTAYHVAVVKAVGCEEIDQAVRTSIKDKYETANTAWHDMQNAPPEAIDQIGILCTADVQYVHSQSDGKCTTSASR